MPKYSYDFTVIIDRYALVITRESYSDFYQTAEEGAAPVISDLYRDLKTRYIDSAIGIKLIRRVEIE
jgi:hypothetical protein